MSILDNPLVLAVGTVVIALILALALVLVGYQVGQTKAAQWAGRHAGAQIDRVRDAYARKRAKAGAP